MCAVRLSSYHNLLWSGCVCDIHSDSEPKVSVVEQFNIWRLTLDFDRYWMFQSVQFESCTQVTGFSVCFKQLWNSHFVNNSITVRYPAWIWSIICYLYSYMVITIYIYILYYYIEKFCVNYRHSADGLQMIQQFASCISFS